MLIRNKLILKRRGVGLIIPLLYRLNLRKGQLASVWKCWLMGGETPLAILVFGSIAIELHGFTGRWME